MDVKSGSRFLFVLGLLSFVCYSEAADRNILVLGGNGFLGASTVERLLEAGDQVTIVNRGNWYWDSETRILPRVKHIKCDRTKGHKTCPDLGRLVNETTRFDAVFDFSAYGPDEAQDTMTLLKDKVALYIMISTDSVYDACRKKSARESEPAVESDAVWPEDEELKKTLTSHHSYGSRKFQAEEELVAQRNSGGFPYIILRLPDVIGPRDTTFRFWLYQLWIKLSPHFSQHPVIVPYFLNDYPMSFVYSEDVAKMAVRLLDLGHTIHDEAFNLAWPETHTLESFLRTVEDQLMPDRPHDFPVDKQGTSNYFYPSVRTGPISVKKAEELLQWAPTPWKQAIHDSVQFYEEAMATEKFKKQRDEIVQITHTQIFSNDSTNYYKTIEKIYDIDLRHYYLAKDEL